MVLGPIQRASLLLGLVDTVAELMDTVAEQMDTVAELWMQWLNYGYSG